MTNPFAALAREPAIRAVRYVVIGVSGANLYAPAGQAVFATEDFDLFLPPDPDWLAERVVERRDQTRASGPEGLAVDLTLVMKGYDFPAV